VPASPRRPRSHPSTPPASTHSDAIAVVPTRGGQSGARHAVKPLIPTSWARRQLSATCRRGPRAGSPTARTPAYQIAPALRQSPPRRLRRPDRGGGDHRVSSTMRRRRLARSIVLVTSRRASRRSSRAESVERSTDARTPSSAWSSGPCWPSNRSTANCGLVRSGTCCSHDAVHACHARRHGGCAGRLEFAPAAQLR